MCFGCKQVLCFDRDRSEHIKKLLQSNPDKITKIAASLEPFISKRDTPAHWRQCGMIKDHEVYTSMSCFHYAHPDYFNLHETTGEQHSGTGSDDDEQLSSLTGSAASTSSPPFR